MPKSQENIITQRVSEGFVRRSHKRRTSIPHSLENAKILFNERRGAKFTRNIPLPRDVDASAVDAELISEVLRITINKRTELMPRKIEIRRQSTGS